MDKTPEWIDVAKKSTKVSTKVSPKVSTKVSPKVSTKVSPKVSTKVSPKVSTKVSTKVSPEEKNIFKPLMFGINFKYDFGLTSKIYCLPKLPLSYEFLNDHHIDHLEVDLSKIDLDLVRKNFQICLKKPNACIKRFISVMLECKYDLFRDWVNGVDRSYRLIDFVYVKMLYIWYCTKEYFCPNNSRKYWEFISFTTKNCVYHGYDNHYIKHEISILETQNIDWLSVNRGPKLSDPITEIRIADNYSLDELDIYLHIHTFYMRFLAFKYNYSTITKAFISRFNGLVVLGPSEMSKYFTSSDSGLAECFRKITPYPDLDTIFLQQYVGSYGEPIPPYLKESQAFPEKLYPDLDTNIEVIEWA